MINTIMSIIGTGVVIAGAMGTILKGFYKTNKEATNDYQAIGEAGQRTLNALNKILQDVVENNLEILQKHYKM